MPLWQERSENGDIRLRNSWRTDIQSYDDHDNHDKHDVDFANMMLIKYKHDDMIKSAWNLFELMLDRFACDC